MNRETERNIRSDDFLQENKDDFTANAYATAKITALHARVEEVGDEREEQISSGGGVRQNYDIAGDANDELTDAMRDVADIAVTMGDEIDGIEEKFRLTRTGGKRARIARARAFADDAEPHEEIFKGRGLRADFIANLRAKADALENALAGAVSETGKRVGATGKITLAVSESNKIIKNLDPIVRMRYRDDAAKLAAWIFASKVQRDSQPKPKPNTPTT